ncbi:hypothetical protein [Dyella agri]|uniref:hypothetical protein n=1 Tax=Dyella agri TaxID=1926869 RepID=UPI00384B4809
MQRQSGSSGYRAPRCYLQGESGAEHETTQGFAQCCRFAAAQQQQQAVFVQPRQVEQGTYTALCAQPSAELPGADGKRWEVAAELRLRKGERVGPFDQQGFGVAGSRHRAVKMRPAMAERKSSRREAHTALAAFVKVVRHCGKY